jgi:hypothetical protein
VAFLSLLDERARPKGSRDPLGFELVWTHFGRKVVGNLTTVTSSWRIFSVGLLGFYWCNQLCRDAHPQEKQALLQQHFVRYEQLAAYLRSSAGDDELLGVKRVRKRLVEDSRMIHIGNDPQDLILSDQVSYGIWGLYSTALRESELVCGEHRELTEEGLAIVRQIEARLDTAWFWAFLRGDLRSIARADLSEQGKTFVKAIASRRVRDALMAALLHGPKGHRCQYSLYEAVHQVPVDVLRQEGLGTGQFIAVVRAVTTAPELQQILDDIPRVERLLVTANILFDYCRRKDGEDIESVAAAITTAYNFAYLPEEPPLESCPYAKELMTLSGQLKTGQVLAGLRTLLALNKVIMEGRGGAAWVEENGDGTLRVRMNAEAAQLLPQEKLESDWHYDYFLRSYARIASMERA